jgi:hypothetical protein
MGASALDTRYIALLGAGVFLRNSHKSKITQFQHCGVRARQV